MGRNWTKHRAWGKEWRRKAIKDGRCLVCNRKHARTSSAGRRLTACGACAKAQSAKYAARKANSAPVARADSPEPSTCLPHAIVVQKPQEQPVSALPRASWATPERRAEVAGMGARARAELLSPTRRSEIAQAAAFARWGK